jgi:hypothetical protein
VTAGQCGKPPHSVWDSAPLGLNTGHAERIADRLRRPQNHHPRTDESSQGKRRSKNMPCRSRTKPQNDTPLKGLEIPSRGYWAGCSRVPLMTDPFASPSLSLAKKTAAEPSFPLRAFPEVTAADKCPISSPMEKQAAPGLICRVCDAPMALANVVPRFGPHPELQSFRCLACGEVETRAVEIDQDAPSGG